MAMFGQLIVPVAFVFAAIISAITAFRQKRREGDQRNNLDSVPVLRKRLSSDADDRAHVSQNGIEFDAIDQDQPDYLPTTGSVDPPELLPTTWSERVLQMIEWKRFEIITREFLSLTGYKAHETNVGADGGVDIRITKRGNDTFKGIVQCKAWNAYKVGVKPVRELYGVMAAEGIKNGMLITSGTFTAEAEEFSQGKIMLVSGAKFLELIGKLPEQKRQALLEVALEGDFRTPTCPQCDVKMTLRESGKGRNAGGQFWGCIRYPRCKQTLVYKQE